MRSLDAPAHQLARGRSSLCGGAVLVRALAWPAAAAAATGDTALRFARSVAATGRARPPATARRAPSARSPPASAAPACACPPRRSRVPGKGRSRNVIGVRRGRGRCVRVVMAHADTVARSPGANDNASGPGRAGRAGRAHPPGWPAVRAVAGGHRRRGAHLHRRPRPPGRAGPGPPGAAQPRRRPGCAGRCRWTRSGAGARWCCAHRPAAQRSGVERAMAAAARRERVPLRWQRDASGGLSDHREFHLLGLRAMKLGESASCYHQPCDRPAAGPRRARAPRARGGQGPGGAVAPSRLRRPPRRPRRPG